ncbi:MAG: tyrosine-protein kinase family protein [Nocardioidaceae bacterium]
MRISGHPKGLLKRRAALIAWVTVLTVAAVLDIVWLSDDQGSPNYPLVVGLGLLGGLALGMGLAYVWDRYAGRLRRVSDIQAATGLPVLGAVPTLPRDDGGRNAGTGDRPIEGLQAYGHVATGLADIVRASRANCLLVTSPTAGAGRTTTAVNLATLLAADGLKVVLVSADQRGGRVDEVLGLRAQPGLTEVLDGSSSLDSALQPGGVERLSVLTSGAPSHEALDYSIDNLARLLDRLTKDVDVVVMDAPPVLGGLETVLLAQDVDLILLVVDVRHGRRSDASAAVTYLGHVQDRIVGCLANNPGRPRRSGRPSKAPAPAADPTAEPVAETAARVAPTGPAAVASWVALRLRRGAGTVGAAAGSVGRGARTARAKVASGASLRAVRRHPLVGVIATALAVAMVLSTVWWLSYDDSSDARNGAVQNPDASLAATASAPEDAVEAAMAECRSQRKAQSEPLRTAESSLNQWQVHVDAMNQLVAGEITLDQANAFWERSRVRAARKIDRFHSADDAYTAGQYDCRPPPAASNAEVAVLAACQHSIAERDSVLRAARVAIGTWHHHVMDMNQMRAGDLSPARAVQLWNNSWQDGMAELDKYRALLREADGSC